MIYKLFTVKKLWNLKETHCFFYSKLHIFSRYILYKCISFTVRISIDLGIYCLFYNVDIYLLFIFCYLTFHSCAIPCLHAAVTKQFPILGSIK